MLTSGGGAMLFMVMREQCESRGVTWGRTYFGGSYYASVYNCIWFKFHRIKYY